MFSSYHIKFSCECCIGKQLNIVGKAATIWLLAISHCIYTCILACHPECSQYASGIARSWELRSQSMSPQRCVWEPSTLSRRVCYHGRVESGSQARNSIRDCHVRLGCLMCWNQHLLWGDFSLVCQWTEIRRTSLCVHRNTDESNTVVSSHDK